MKKTQKITKINRHATYLLSFYEIEIEHHAALYLNKHTHFFIITAVLWTDDIPEADKILLILWASGLRKF